MKVKVVGRTLDTVFGCIIEGDECGREVALVQIFTGSLGAADAAGARVTATPMTVATTNTCFMMGKEYRPTRSLPLNSCWGFASNIQSNSVDFAYFVGNPRGNLC